MNSSRGWQRVLPHLDRQPCADHCDVGSTRPGPASSATSQQHHSRWRRLPATETLKILRTSSPWSSWASTAAVRTLGADTRSRRPTRRGDAVAVRQVTRIHLPVSLARDPFQLPGRTPPYSALLGTLALVAIVSESLAPARGAHHSLLHAPPSPTRSSPTPAPRVHRTFLGRVGISVGTSVGIVVVVVLGMLRGHASHAPKWIVMAITYGVTFFIYAVMAPVLLGFTHARYLNEVLNHTTVGPHRLSARFGTGTLIGLYLSNVFLIIITAGIYTPWAQAASPATPPGDRALEAQGSLEQLSASASTAVPGAAMEELGLLLRPGFRLLMWTDPRSGRVCTMAPHRSGARCHCHADRRRRERPATRAVRSEAASSCCLSGRSRSANGSGRPTGCSASPGGARPRCSTIRPSTRRCTDVACAPPSRGSAASRTAGATP